MPKQQRMMRVEQKGQMAALERLETRTDEELAAETKHRMAAQMILGRRAAEKYDAKNARAHFQKAMVFARSPQERQQLRRVADASLALAERRADDLKAATERLGVEGPTKGQLRGLKLMGLVWPPKSAGTLLRIRGIVIIIVAIVAILLLAFGIVTVIALPFGGMSVDLRIFWGFVLLVAAFFVRYYYARRKQKAMAAERAAGQPASRR